MRSKVAALGVVSVGVLSLVLIVAACSSDSSETPSTPGDAGATDDGISTRPDSGPGVDADTCLCDPPFATGVCEAGACTIAKCNKHRLNCDDNIDNGCELTDDTALGKCGGCNQICEDCTIGSIERMAKTPIVTGPVAASCERGVCCPGGDAGACVTISLDFTPQTGDQPRVTSTKSAADRTALITARFRVKTPAGGGIPVNVPNVGACSLEIDTSAGSNPDFRVDVTWTTLLVPDGGGAVKTDDGAFTLSMELPDVKLTGSAACTSATPGLGYFIDVLTPIFEPIFRTNVCESCPCQTK